MPTVVLIFGSNHTKLCGVNHLLIAAQIVVFAASSLTNVLQAAATAFEQQSGVQVLVNVGASNSQARQIVEGAPADVFCSADEAQMDVAEGAGKVVAGTRVKLALNQLVVVVPRSRARTFARAADLLDASIVRIAVGNPAAVPVGVYTRAYLERAGLWARLESKVIPALSARAALAAVESHNADAAFVYATDAAITANVAIAFRVPAADAPPIVYTAAITTGGANQVDGRRFLAFLRSAAGRALFGAAGFPLPPA